MARLALQLAARFIPPGAAVKELQEVQAILCAETACAVIRAFPQQGARLLQEAYANVGRQMAQRLKQRFRLRPVLSDLTSLWRMVCNLGGVDYRVSREDTRVIFSHTKCPLWEAFRRCGEFHCQETCFAMIRALTEAIAPAADVEVVRPPGASGPCAKAIHLEETPA